jgi:DNA polymerase III subunit delta'
MSQGSPGQAIELWQSLQLVTPELKAQVLNKPRTIRQALRAAKQIDKELDNLAQLALLEYLQYHYWQADRDERLVKAVAEGRRQLLAYVQPRLVWEGLLLSLLPGTR